MIRLSRLTDYAVVIVAELARAPGQTCAAAILAARTGIPEPTVAKVLKTLAKAELVSSARGVNGGYALERAPEDVSIASLVQAVNGPIILTACVEGVEEECNIASQCQLRGRWNPVNDAIRKAFSSVTLADLMAQPETATTCAACVSHKEQQTA